MNAAFSLSWILLLVALLLFTACKKDRVLPPLTMEGKNVMGCLVNGRVVRDKGNFGFYASKSCYYEKRYPADNGYYFHVGCVDKSVANEQRSININVDSMIIREGRIIRFEKQKRGAASAVYNEWYDVNLNAFATDNVVGGELVIKKFDEQNSIVAGTFWFNVINSKGDTIRITEGRFDMHFPF